ncbi:MAG TPA: nuclear transport factor 2 family protein [Kofleriaceae bacterium]|nr:nuclear transport factor 2 family protein [Kofleriaceae bacterium]
MRRLALLVAVTACGGSAPPPAAPQAEQAVDETKAERGAKDLVHEVYEDIGHADTDSLLALLSDPLIVFGPRRADALATRADALVALKQHVDPKAKHKPELRSGDLAVIASPGGRSAWAYDVVDVAGQPVALTAVLSNTGDVWLVTAAALAQTPPMRQVKAELKQDAVVPPGMTGIAKVDPGARAAVDKFQRGLATQQVWGDDLAMRSDAVVIGPSAGDLARGKAEIKKLWKRRVKENVREVAAGEITAGATPDGELAWVSAPVVKFDDLDEPLPLRVFLVFEKAGADWKLIALHESLALDAPGAATALKKIAPPPEPKAEPAAPPKTADAPPRKKRHKKKKPPPEDDPPD